MFSFLFQEYMKFNITDISDMQLSIIIYSSNLCTVMHVYMLYTTQCHCVPLTHISLSIWPTLAVSKLLSVTMYSWMSCFLFHIKVNGMDHVLFFAFCLLFHSTWYSLISSMLSKLEKSVSSLKLNNISVYIGKWLSLCMH